jgi:predicted porin
MKQKLAVIAVAGAFAAPGLALAQTSVTITGYVKVAVGQISNANSGNFRTTGGVGTPSLNKSEWRLTDDGGTRIAFDVRDDVGGGLAGVARIELRPVIDGNLNFGSSAGNQWIGLESKDYGTLRLGAIDQHYNGNTETSATYGPKATESTLISYNYVQSPHTAAAVATGAGAAQAGIPIANTFNGVVQGSIAGASRTRNVVRWDSPNWNGFRVGVGYSFNTLSGFEGDLATAQRKGSSLNINPSYTAATWRIGYSYLDDKRDAIATGTAVASGGGNNAQNWKGNRLYGDVKLGDFTVGLNWDKTSVTALYGTIVGSSLNTVSTPLSSRTAWSLPVKYQSGKHVVTGLYSKANNDSTINSFAVANGLAAAAGYDNSAKLWSVTYAYLFSARTSVGVGYAVLTNAANGAYTLSSDTGGTTAATASGYNSANAGAYMGEKQSYFGVSLRQAF